MLLPQAILLALLQPAPVIRQPAAGARVTLVRAAAPESAFPASAAETATDGAADTEAALRSAWDRGEGATSMRPLVEAIAASERAQSAAAAAARSTDGWPGLWVARIEHFEKVRGLGLRVRPHYDLRADAREGKATIVSHVHVALGPLRGWLSASGAMAPASASNVRLVFDDFWISADTPTPRPAPPDGPTADMSVVDRLTRVVGRAAFFESLGTFPVDYADLDRGLVSFRFPPLNSCIVAQRAPDGEPPRRVTDL